MILYVSWAAVHEKCASDHTVSSNDDVTEACVTREVLIFARTGAPNPIEESWRLH